jgi:hypothetical protein
MLYWAGMRLGELIALTMEYFDFEKKESPYQQVLSAAEMRGLYYHAQDIEEQPHH